MFLKIGDLGLELRCDGCGGKNIYIGRMVYDGGQLSYRDVSCLDCGKKCPNYPPALPDGARISGLIVG